MIVWWWLIWIVSALFRIIERGLGFSMLIFFTGWLVAIVVFACLECVGRWQDRKLRICQARLRAGRTVYRGWADEAF